MNSFYKLTEDFKVPGMDLLLESGDIILIEDEEMMKKIKEANKKKKVPQRNVIILSEDIEVEGNLIPKGTPIKIKEADMQYTFGWGEPKVVKARYKTILTPGQEDELRDMLLDQIGEETQIEFSEEKVDWLIQHFQNEGYPAEGRAMEDFAKKMINEYDHYIKSIIDEVNAEGEFTLDYYKSEEGYGDYAYLMEENDFQNGTLPDKIMDAIRDKYSRREAEDIKTEIIRDCYQELSVEYDYEQGYGMPWAEGGDIYIYYGSLGHIDELELQFRDELADKLEELTDEEFETVSRYADVYIRDRDRQWGYVGASFVPFWYSEIVGSERTVNDILQKYDIDVRY